MVGGLTGVPLVAVPTSVGYGASFDGLAALLGDAQLLRARRRRLQHRQRVRRRRLRGPRRPSRAPTGGRAVTPRRTRGVRLGGLLERRERRHAPRRPGRRRRADRGHRQRRGRPRGARDGRRTADGRRRARRAAGRASAPTSRNRRGRTLRDVAGADGRRDLDPRVRDAGHDVFERLAEAEADGPRRRGRGRPLPRGGRARRAGRRRRLRGRLRPPLARDGRRLAGGARDRVARARRTARSRSPSPRSWSCSARPGFPAFGGSAPFEQCTPTGAASSRPVATAADRCRR